MNAQTLYSKCMYACNVYMHLEFTEFFPYWIWEIWQRKQMNGYIVLTGSRFSS